MLTDEVDMNSPLRVPIDGSLLRLGAGATSHLLTFASGETRPQSVYGLRVAFDGSALDEFPFPITRGPVELTPPAEVAFNGTDWLAVWGEERNGLPSNLYGARIAADGTVRDQGGIAIALGPRATLGKVASNGSGFIVTWQTVDGVHAAIVDATGAVTRRLSVQPVSAGAASAVGFNGTDYLVVFSGSDGGQDYLRAKRLTQAGDSIGSVIDLGSSSSAHVHVSSDGTGWLVAHGIRSEGLGWRLVGADGSPGASGSVANITDPSSVSWDGSSYWVSASSGQFRLALARIDGAGSLLGSVVHDEHSALGSFVVHGGGTPFIAFWPPKVGNAVIAPAFGSRLDSTLALRDEPPRVLATGANWQFRPRAASDGNGYLTVWSDRREEPLDQHVYAQRFTSNGSPLESGGFAVSSDPGELPDAAFGGSQYLVVWQDTSREIRAKRVSPMGILLNDADVRITSMGYGPTVASNGTDYFVTWGAGVGVRGARVLADGRVSGAELAISNAGGEPAVASNGSRYLVAWNEGFDIKAKRVNAVGAVMDAMPIAVSSRMSSVPFRAQVASDGTHWFVVWGSTDGIFGARVAGNGEVVDARAITIDQSYAGGSGAVTWTGDAYLVTWSQRDAGDAVFGRRVSSCGELLDASRFPIAPDALHSGSTDFVDVAGNGLGSALVTYTRFEKTLVAKRARIRTITGGEPADCGEAGAGGAGASSGAGPGGVGGVDGGAAGESSGGAGDLAGEGPGGPSVGGASGRGASGASGSNGDGSGGTSGSESEDDGRRDRTHVTEGCGCRTTAAPTNQSALLLAFAIVASAVSRKSSRARRHK